MRLYDLGAPYVCTAWMSVYFTPVNMTPEEGMTKDDHAFALVKRDGEQKMNLTIIR
jgi:hypothetical protein